MLIAHLPSGFIVGTLMRNRLGIGRDVMPAALVGIVAPDLDMFYFHFVDGGRVYHHAYVTHWPLFWISIGRMRWRVGEMAAAIARDGGLGFSSSR